MIPTTADPHLEALVRYRRARILAHMINRVVWLVAGLAVGLAFGGCL